MLNSLNQVTLIGRLGADPDIRSTKDGKEVASFSLATSESWKDRTSGERKEKTEWHRIVVFNEGLVGIIKNYVKKGSKIYIEGSLQTRKWVDQGGQEKYTTEIVLQGFNANIILLDSKEQSGSSSVQAKSNDVKQSNDLNDYLDDELPF